MTDTRAPMRAHDVRSHRRAGPLVAALSTLGAHVGTFALFLIMMSAVVDVAVRKLSDRSVPGMLESAEVTLVVAAFLGLAYAQRTRQHVSMTFIIERLPASVARWLRAAGLLAFAGYAGWATVLSAGRAWESFRGGEVRFGLIEIPQWPARLAIAIGFGLLLLEVLRDLRGAALGRSAGGHRDRGTL